MKTKEEKRFYAACAVIQGIMANSTLSDIDWNNNNIDRKPIKTLTTFAYMIADELLKQEGV